MISKMQKTWLWVFSGMVIVPELVFSILPSSVINYSGKDFLTLTSLFVDDRFFINNPSYFLFTLIVEIVGVIGLLVISIKYRKKVFITFLVAILLWLLFILFLGYVTSTIQLVM